MTFGRIRTSRKGRRRLSTPPPQQCKSEAQCRFGAGTADTNRRYYGLDERGSVISVSNNTGAKVYINAYDEYGRPQSTNGGRYQYTGQKWIPEANLYDYKARDYLPHLGIFAQTDPIGYGEGPNWYAYTGNDPVDMTDPLGFDSDTWRTPQSPPPPPCDAECEILVEAMRLGISFADGDLPPWVSIFPGFDRIPSLASLRLEGREFKPTNKCALNSRDLTFLRNNYVPALSIAVKYNTSVVGLLSIAAHESTWGASPMAKLSHNPFGFTPHGDSTPGLRYHSFFQAWSSWGNTYGPRVRNTGGNIDLFVSRLLQDNRGVAGAVDQRGPYNSEDPLWGSEIKDTTNSVASRLSRWGPAC